MLSQSIGTPMMETLESRLFLHGAEPILTYPIGTLVPWLAEPIEPAVPETDSTSSPLPNRNVGTVVSLTLVNAATDLDLSPLTHGMQLSVAGGATYSVRANLGTGGIVGSIQFLLDGKVLRTESDVPYAVAGTVGGDYSPWTVPGGNHVLTALPFSGAAATGIPGSPLSISFTVVD